MNARATLVPTRQALHAIAELVLAGPQYRAHGTIRLRLLAGGVATTAGPEVGTDGITVRAGDRTCTINGRTPADVAQAVGLTASGLEDVYPAGSGPGLHDQLDVSVDAAAYLLACLAAGDEALAQLAPEADRVLWPEHFDVGIAVHAVNYGVSPGDDTHPHPYAYVGPHSPIIGTFWNEPFGASMPLGEVPDADGIAAFFAAGRAEASRAGEPPPRGA